MRTKRMSVRTWALMGAGIAALASPAAAQTATSGNNDISEIVVTAQRRSEHLIDVPASVAVATGERLEAAHLTDILDIARVMPGVSTENTGTFSRPAIRGISTTINSVTNSGNVATYLDGVYQQSTVGNYFDLVDIEQIEVLKGPQGTLYGRNATAGAIIISTKAPSFTRSGKAEFGYGNYNWKRFNAYLTGPLTDNLAGSLSVGYSDTPGYYRNIFLNTKTANQNRQSVRAKLLYKPNDWSQYTLIAAQGFMSDTSGAVTGPFAQTSAQQNNPLVIKPGPYQISHNFNPIQKLNTYDATLRAEFFLPGVDVTSTSAWRTVAGRIATDADFSNLPQNTLFWRTWEESISQDILAASSKEGPFRWLAGANWTTESGGYLNYFSGTLPEQNTNVRTNAYSAFVEGTYEYQKFSVTAGVRYITERRHYLGSRKAPQLLSVDNAVKWNAWTPRVSAKYALTDTSNIYANYSTGWKSGGYNTSNPASQAFPFNPERVKGYEVGYKARPSSLISIEAAVYNYKYTDIQTTASLIQPGAAAGVSVLYNAAQARSKGAELSLGIYPISGLNIQAGLAYNDAKFTSFPTAFVTYPNTVTPPPFVAGSTTVRQCIAGTGAPTGGNRQCVSDASGSYLPRSAKWTWSIGGNYKRDVEMGTVDMGANVFYNSGPYYDALNRLKGPSYVLLDGTIGFSPRNTGVRISVWGKNLLDKVYPMYFIDQTLADRITYAQPRTYGATIGVKF